MAILLDNRNQSHARSLRLASMVALGAAVEQFQRAIGHFRNDRCGLSGRAWTMARGEASGMQVEGRQGQ